MFNREIQDSTLSQTSIEDIFSERKDCEGCTITKEEQEEIDYWFPKDSIKEGKNLFGRYETKDLQNKKK